MSHEQSETIERDGKFINVYGQGLPQAGEQLPGTSSFDTIDDAVTAAKSRSASFDAPHEHPGSLPGVTGLGDAAIGLYTASEAAMPSPPPGYHPGPLAPVRQEYEDSMLYKVGSVLASYGESVPVNLKIKMAQQEMDLKQQTNKLAWDNYYKSNEVARNLSKAQNRDASKEFLQLLPNMKAQLFSMVGESEEKRRPFLNHMKNIAESLHPGGGDLLEFFSGNMSTVFAADAILSHPDKSISGQSQALVGQMGYDQWIKSPQHAVVARQMNTDYLTAVVGRLPKPVHDKLVSKGLPEPEFRELVKKQAYEQGMRPVDVASMLAHLDTEEGDGQMANMGVKTNKAALAQQVKSHELTAIEQGRNEEYLSKKSILDDHAANPGKYNDSYIKTVKDEVAVFHKLQAPETSPGPNPNNTFNNAFKIATQGKLGSVDDIAKLPAKEQAAMYKVAEKTLGEVRAASAEAQKDAKMSTPAIADNYINADELLKTGKVVPVREAVSEGEIRTNRKYIKITPEQRKELRELNVAVESAKQIFDSADQAFSGDTNAMTFAIAERALLAEDNILTAPQKAIAKGAYPKLAEYLARREGTLGKFARGVSGEVGVLTDQDVGRVRNLFPVGGDTPELRKAKRKSMENLLALNRKFAHEVLAGEMSPDEAAALKNSDKYKSAVNGLFGSLEGNIAGSTAPQGAPPGESLLKKMKKGKP